MRYLLAGVLYLKEFEIKLKNLGCVGLKEIYPLIHNVTEI